MEVIIFAYIVIAGVVFLYTLLQVNSWTLIGLALITAVLWPYVILRKLGEF